LGDGRTTLEPGASDISDAGDRDGAPGDPSARVAPTDAAKVAADASRQR